MNFGIDIDGTITANPELFSILSRAIRRDGGQVHIVSSRTRDDDVMEATQLELRRHGIVYDHIYLLPPQEVADATCRHDGLDWYQRFIYQKVQYCLDHDVVDFFDDEAKVVELFGRFAPGITVLRISPSA